MKYITAISAIVFFLVSYSAFSETYYIYQTGTDNDECSLANPCTWEAAERLASDGDSIELAPLPATPSNCDMRRITQHIVNNPNGTAASNHNTDHVAKESAINKAMQNPGHVFVIQGADYAVACD